MMMTFSCGRNARRIVTTCALFTLLNTSNATVIDDISNLINLFNFSPQKGCLDECVTPLLIAVYDMVAYGNSRTHFADLCIEYSLALSCFESKAERCKANVELFKVLTSGLHVACDAERSIFDSAFACVDVFKDKPLSECERSCHLYGGLRDWTSSSYLKTLGNGGEALLSSLRYAGPFCRMRSSTPDLTDLCNRVFVVPTQIPKEPPESSLISFCTCTDLFGNPKPSTDMKNFR
ncbi:unnamed protein product [Toxocara canis]|uniref:CPG4 domain-containing protein n=1 Tax=Toxocara canis TaxID=6265 RepID=A0A183VG73_TOXCA|nr:unnamed protein product [Toxocara canis]